MKGNFRFRAIIKEPVDRHVFSSFFYMFINIRSNHEM